MKINIKPLLLIILIFVLFTSLLPHSAFAASDIKNPSSGLQISIPGLRFSDAKECQTDSGDKALCVNWIGEYISSIYNYGIAIAGIVAAVVMMFGGVIWLTAGGNASRIGEAKNWIGASITGIILTLTSYMIMQQINPDLISSVSKPLTLTSVPEKLLNSYESLGGGDIDIPRGTVPNTYDETIKRLAQKYNLEPAMIKAIMATESGGRAGVVSRAGAIGLMQLMPGTASDLGVNPNNPEENLDGGSKMISRLINKYGNVENALMAYNWGPGNMDVYLGRQSKPAPGCAYKGCPMKAETRAYPATYRSYYNCFKSNFAANTCS
ncbi:lytic transglycosylase domain-containing protein [Candidatus Falkowbacteria bacterium]|nr:lytic transglycosylase domain-containing protein [Candidatus Falkowbacteria bacterium]